MDPATDAAMQEVIRLYELGERQQALRLCVKILKEHPSHIEALGYKAALLRELNQTEAAVAAYQELTEALAEEGQFLRALAAAREFESIEPTASELTTKRLAEQFHNEQGVVDDYSSSDEVMLLDRYGKESTLTNGPPLVNQFRGDTNEEYLHELLLQLEQDTVVVEDEYVEDPFQQVERTQVMRPVPPKPVNEDFPTFDSQPPLQTIVNESVSTTDTAPELIPPPLPPLFNYLDAESIAAVWKLMEPLQFPGGYNLINEGEEGDSFFIIVDGTVRILQSVDDTQEEMGHLGPGQFFGEISLLTPLKRVATVQTVSSCQLLRLSRSDLQSIVVQYPQVHKELRRFIHHRLLQNLVITSLLFFPLSDIKRWELAQRFLMIELPPDHTIANEGQAMDGFYIVAGGAVDVYQLSPTMDFEWVEQLRPGQFFGELPLMYQIPSRYTYVTQEPVTLLKLDVEGFADVLIDYPKVHDLLQAVAKTRHVTNPSSDS